MKKFASLLLACTMVLSVAGCGSSPAPSSAPAPASTPQPAQSAAADPMEELIAAAKAEGTLVVYGCCEESYVNAACDNFEKLYGIKVERQRLSTGEVQAKITEENGNPSADVWFGGTTDPYNEVTAAGLLEPYKAMNASHLMSAECSDPDGNWYGIYKGILGIFYNQEELDRLKLDAPKDWDELIDPKYKGLIAVSNPSTAGTAKLFINTMVQMKGHDEAMEYFKALDANITQYTKSGSGPIKMIGPGEITVGVGFLHDAIYQILQGYDNIGMCVPASGTSYEIGATAIFKGAKHPNAAKLWIEYALSPDCVEQAAPAGQYQFLVIDNAKQPQQAIDFGLDPNNVISYDFEDAKQNTSKYVEDFFGAVTGGSASGADANRFKVE